MRPFARYAFLAYAVIAFLPGLPAHAQGGPGGGGGGGGGGQDEDDAKKRQRDEEWGTNAKQLDLPQLRNAGPCPYVKVLYDAARYVEVKGALASNNVGFTGEIENLASACEYKATDPIRVQARLLFEFGRGPQAQGAQHTYRYWVAVTDRNRAVLDKEYFDVPIVFPAGQDRVEKTEDVFGITIPRADLHVSGANFEVLVGFDVTQDMADMNAAGERFLANAGQPGAAVASGASGGDTGGGDTGDK